MKSKFVFAANVLMATFAMISLTACPSPDDPDLPPTSTPDAPTPSPTPSPTPDPTPGTVPLSSLVDLNGNKVYISSFGPDWANGYYTYNYNEAGQLAGFIYYGSKYYVNVSSFVISSDDGETTAYIETNSDGLISKMKIVEEEYDDDEWEKETQLMSYTYNEAKQLISVSYSYYGEEIEDNKHQTYSGSGNLTNTWVNGNLVQSVHTVNGIEPEDDDYYNYQWIDTYTFDYGNDLNPIKQYPFCLTDAVNMYYEFEEPLCLLGFYGVGSANLPTKKSIKESYSNSEGDRDEYVRNYNLSFILNANGTIRTETRTYISEYSQSSSTYTWQYGTNAPHSIAKQAENVIQDVKKISPIKSHSRRRHNK